jgi:cytochrome c553
MKVLRVLGALLVLIVASTLAWWYVEQSRPPQLVFAQSYFDFGKVAEGATVRHIFQILNKGGKTLVIKEAKSTCDCTIAKLKQNSVPPGGTVNLEVAMDTTMKEGLIHKDILVTSNDPVHPQAKISVAANVDPHVGLSDSCRAKIFTGRCAVCHVQQGIGKRGEDLYIADCAMCHGFRADGGEAPSLIRFNCDHKQVTAFMQDVISYGSRSHLSMPGFLAQAGGPLTRAQIDSLVEYLCWRSKQTK